MPRSKKPRLLEGADDHVSGDSTSTAAVVAERPSTATDAALSVDTLAMIFGHFGPKDIMCLRCVSKKWREAAKKTIVPLSHFCIDCANKYYAVRAMTTALPNLQELSILYMEDGGHIFNNGEDPNLREAIMTSRYNSHDIGIISRFTKLCCLNLFQASMNGVYPFLFEFPLLRKLNIGLCDYLEFDLDMLAQLPLLEDFESTYTPYLTGNLSSLRVLKDTLQKIHIHGCEVEGSLMDLSDFLYLKELHLMEIDVEGDVRDIRESDFPSLEDLSLPESVVGGMGHDFQSICDVPEVMQAIYRLKLRGCFTDERYWRLSDESPDRYDGHIGNNMFRVDPPFKIDFVEAGTRRGWRWWGRSHSGTVSHACVGTSSCEINWFDREPDRDRESCDYEKYVQKLEQLEQEINFYRGYLQPPTEEEYNRLCTDLET